MTIYKLNIATILVAIYGTKKKSATMQTNLQAFLYLPMYNIIHNT